MEACRQARGFPLNLARMVGRGVTTVRLHSVPSERNAGASTSGDEGRRFLLRVHFPLEPA